jgi:hypothetical protein
VASSWASSWSMSTVMVPNRPMFSLQAGEMWASRTFVDPAPLGPELGDGQPEIFESDHTPREGPVGTIHCLNAAATGMRLDGAVEAFLTEIPNANTARAYSLALRALVTELGAETLTINV